MMFKYMCLVLFITWYQLADCHPASSNVKAIDSMIEKVKFSNGVYREKKITNNNNDPHNNNNI